MRSLENQLLIKIVAVAIITVIAVIVLIRYIEPQLMVDSEIRYHKAIDMIPAEEKANYCNLDSDCVFTGYCRPIGTYTLSMAIIVNKDEVSGIKKMLENVNVIKECAINYVAPNADDITCDNHIGKVNLTRKMCIDSRFI